MRLIFAGTPEFAVTTLRALLGDSHQIALVLTQPDRKAGRGKKLRASPVKEVALDAGLPIFQPQSLRDAAGHQRLADCHAELMIVAAYGLILPAAVLAINPLGCINVHASVLPRWRGAAPIQRAIEAGDTETGITIMQMDAGLDTGPMLLVRKLSIGLDETGGELHDRLATLGARTLTEALARLPELVPENQPEHGATYAHRLTRSDAAIDWSLSANDLLNRVRAFDPVPGSATHLDSAPRNRLKIWRLKAAPGQLGARPGVVLQADADLIRVACADGQAVDILQLQRAGGKRLETREFQRGQALTSGQLLIGFSGSA